jgi:alpha-galactosidase
MLFGIWVEPEMISPASDLARDHPDWILRPSERLPAESRWQQVLDLSNPEAYAHILERLDRLLTENDIEYLKWDHNRDVLEPGSALSGTAVAVENTIALYALLDELRRRHPNLLIENCASGGSRIDLEMLQRTDRTWVSDTVDPVERAAIQRYTGLILPVGMTGNDIGAEISHTTGRHSSLDFRATVALLGNVGIQWDLRRATAAERKGLAEWVALYKRWRSVLHNGDLVNIETTDPALIVRGVISRDLSAAVFTFVQIASTAAPSAGRVCLPGLEADALYDVRVEGDPSVLRTRAYTPVSWMREGVALSGQTLALVGLEAPVIDPEQGFVVTLQRR